MELIFEDPVTKGSFSVMKDHLYLKGDGILKNSTLSTIVINLRGNQIVRIDNVPYILPYGTLLPLMANQHFVFERPEDILAWQFNREFYCIADHDHEVGCVGFLFYGIIHPFFISLTPEEISSIRLLEDLCVKDMAVKDRMQGEMLRTILKRLIIFVTRIAKRLDKNIKDDREEQLDIVRRFNLLLEANFRSEHEVRFYAGLLNRSPKTLSNLFTLFNYPPPSKLIQQRLILEAKRLLCYTDKSAKEIAFALGFSTPALFSRFFKLHAGCSISIFRSKN